MIPVRILRLAAGGDGIGKLEDGRTVFVPRTAPGDLVELTALREHRRFARARPGRLLEPGSERVEPRCPHFVRDDCGGCQLQHISLPAQQEARRSFVGDALRRLARLDVPDPDLVVAAKAFEYRTKLTLAAGRGGNPIGLRRYDRPDEIFALDRCHITIPELMSLWRELRALVRLLPEDLTRLVLRQDRSGGLHVVVRSDAAVVWDAGPKLRAELSSRGQEATIWWHPEAGAPRAVAGAGEAYPATVFEQIHPEMGDQVRHFAVEQLGDIAGRRIWDLYAGIGETTAILAGAGASVESVEMDRRAVATAESTGPSARRHAGRVEDLLDELSRPDLVVTNPPRTGMDPRVAAAIERARPARVVYVSCDPATLARDITRLPSYRLSAVRAFDLFPQTAHVETVAVLDLAA
ncbi:MAG: class I SAM-dependent RNA methyltransferase [Gemmatimonadales bacterium]